MRGGCGKDKEMKNKDDVIVMCHGRLTGDEELNGKYR